MHIGNSDKEDMVMPSYEYSFPKNRIKVLLLENVHDSAVQVLDEQAFQIERIGKALPEDELVKKIEYVHLLGIRSKTKVTSKVLDAAKQLLAIGCFCIGTDQVDLEAACTAGVPVFNAPFSNTRSVAELVLCELIALARKLTVRNGDLHAGTWSKSAKGCVELRGKTLGIVGFGHIGSQLSVLAEALGMNVIYYDTKNVQRMGNATPCKCLEELLSEAMFVSLHVPKSSTTKGMIGAQQIALMKKGSFLLNASRGSVVDLDAVAEAIKSEHLAGAAVDVFPVEPASNGPGFESPLLQLSNVILTPHVAGSTVEAQKSIGEEVARTLTKFVNQGSTAGAINFPEIDVPHTHDAHRILNVHHNKPGVLGTVNGILAESNTNVHKQMLSTNNNVGYMILDIDQKASEETKKAICAMKYNIKTRILY